MKEIKNRLSEMFANMVSSVGQTQGEVALRRYCVAFLYEPEIPQELLHDQEK